MPCPDHRVAKDKKCVACFTVDIISMTHGLDDEGVVNDHQLGDLAKRYKGLELTADDAECCKTLIFGLNRKLVALKHSLFGVRDAPLILPGAITAQHRQLHRDGLRRRGTWIGITELQVLARLFRVRFLVGFPARDRPLAYEVGAGTDVLVAPSLYWSGNHYEVATLTPHQGGGYTLTNLVHTNGRGDCAVESLLLLLHTARNATPAIMPALSTYSAQLRSVLRLFALVVGAPRVNDLLDTTHAYYGDAIADLRALMVEDMSDAEVNDAIIAEGELPESEEERAAKKRERRSGSKVAAPELALDGDAPALPWSGERAISAKKVGQTGMQPLRLQRIAGTRVHALGGNFNPSPALWTGSLDFVRTILAGKLAGSHDDSTAIYSEQIARKTLAFLDDEGLGMTVRSTHICSCLAAVTMRDGTTHHFLFAAVNMQPGKGRGAQAKVSTLKSGESGTHSEKICLGLLVYVLRGFGVKIGDSVLNPVTDCCEGPAVGASRGHKVRRVDVIFMNIAAMCNTCEGFWGQWRAALLEAGVDEVGVYIWYFLTDIKTWGKK